MKNYFVLGVLALFAITLIGADIAEAKRFGGGMSFGMKRSVKPPAQHRQAPKQQALPNKQRGMAGAGMVGMLGGLMLGGLLSSMFFGGAFENINVMDILIIGGILLLLYRRFIGNREPMTTHSAVETWQSPTPVDDVMSGQIETVQTPDIDVSQFIIAAKDIYMQMQIACDQSDRESIQKYTTAEVYDEIMNQLSAADHQQQTDVAMLDARINEAWGEGSFDYVAVSFNAMIREEESDQHQEVSEVWIFRHERTSDDPTWYIAGIQQLS